MDDLMFNGMNIPENELEETFLTSGGPGGQHANRNETAVRLRFDVAGSSLPTDVKRRISERLGAIVEVTASDSRSQFRNRALARRRLKDTLEAAVREEKARKETKPTRASRRRRLEEKRQRSEKKRLRRAPRAED